MRPDEDPMLLQDNRLRPDGVGDKKGGIRAIHEPLHGSKWRCSTNTISGRIRIRPYPLLRIPNTDNYPVQYNDTMSNSYWQHSILCEFGSFLKSKKFVKVYTNKGSLAKLNKWHHWQLKQFEAFLLLKILVLPRLARVSAISALLLTSSANSCRVSMFEIFCLLPII